MFTSTDDVGSLLERGAERARAGELAELLNGLNCAGPGSPVVPSEYHDVVVTRA